jgi:hypothetical protein
MKKFYFIFLFFILFSFSSMAVDLKTGNVIYFNFSQSSGNILNSAGNVHGIDYSIFSRTETGKIGTGYHFKASSNNYIQIADNNIFDRNANDEFSANLWVYLHSYNEIGWLVNKCDFQTAWNREFCWYILRSDNANAGKILNYVISSKDSSGVSIGENTSKIEIPLNEWVMLTYTGNSTGLSIYMNAERIGGRRYTGGIADDTGAFTIGVMEKTATTTNIDGILDEVAYWNIKLNDTQINKLYNSEFGCNPYGECVEPDSNAPLINTDFINNSQFVRDTIQRFYFNFSDELIKIYNISFYSNDNLILNKYLSNINLNFTKNLTYINLTATGNYYINVIVSDNFNNINNKVYYFNVLNFGVNKSEEIIKINQIQEELKMIWIISLFIILLLLYIFKTDNVLIDMVNMIGNIILTYLFWVNGYEIVSYFTILIIILLASRIYSSKENYE